MLSAIKASEFKGWCLEDEAPPKEFDDMLPEWAQPLLTTPQAWENYSDDLIYEADKRLRQWADNMKSTWKGRRGRDRRYQFTDLCKILGIDSEVKTRKNYNAMSRLFAYYSSKVIKETTINNVRKKKVYCLSLTRLKKPPYSLKLRLEQMQDEGTWHQFQLPKDDLDVGHARNPRTEENIKRRAAKSREAFNEYQAKRRARLDSERRESEGS